MEIQPNKIGGFQPESTQNIEKKEKEDIELVFEEQKVSDEEIEGALIELSSENNMLVTKRKGKDTGIWATLMEEMKSFFEKDESLTEIETKKILEKQLKKRPDTKEFKIHDEFMESKRQEYLVSHPQPQVSSPDNPVFGNAVQMAAYTQWVNNLTNYMNEQETKYREENPDYKAQAEAFEKE